MVTAESWLTVCAACRTIRGADGSWHEPSQPLGTHDMALVTHTVCPRCALRLYPELLAKVRRRCPEAFTSDATEHRPRE